MLLRVFEKLELNTFTVFLQKKFDFSMSENVFMLLNNHTKKISSTNLKMKLCYTSIEVLHMMKNFLLTKNFILLYDRQDKS